MPIQYAHKGTGFQVLKVFMAYIIHTELDNSFQVTKVFMIHVGLIMLQYACNSYTCRFSTTKVCTQSRITVFKFSIGTQ